MENCPFFIIHSLLLWYWIKQMLCLLFLVCFYYPHYFYTCTKFWHRKHLGWNRGWLGHICCFHVTKMPFSSHENCGMHLYRGSNFSNMVGFLEVYIIPVLMLTPKLQEIIFWSLQQNWINVCCIAFFSLGKCWGIFVCLLVCFLEEDVLLPKLGLFLLSPWASVDPTCLNLLLCSQLDLFDVKQLRSFPLREKTVLSLRVKKKIAVFYASLCPI